jgi:phospholipid/cholesterol/gamma-HCH transport system substrate-binding protein
MKLRYRFANQVVGAFVVLAVAVTVALIILMGANQRWFRRNYDFHSVLPDARDVSPGMAVTFRGFTIGRVTDISLNPENEVDMEFYIHEEYLDQIREDSIIQVVSNPLGGGEILLHQGREPTPPLEEGSRIPLYDSKEGLRLRAQDRVVVLRTADPIAQILDQVDPILVNLDRTLLNIAEITGQLRGEGQLVAQDVAAITANLRETTDAFRDPTGIATRLVDPQGSIATLLDDENQLYDNIQEIVGSLEASLASLNESLDQLSNFTAYLNTTQPQISSLLEEGRTTLDSGQDVLEGLRNNPLLRGGIPDEQEQQTTFQGIRDEEF